MDDNVGSEISETLIYSICRFLCCCSNDDMQKLLSLRKQSHIFERSKLRLVTSGEELQQTEKDESEAEDEAEKSKVDDDMEDDMEVVDEDGVKEST